MNIKSYAALQPGEALQRYDYDPGPLQAEDVEVAVEYCGICHSDLSMIDNEWGGSTYPLVAGHEVIGRIVALGDGSQHKGLQMGQRVGIGWTAKSCHYCDACLSGDQVNCRRGKVSTINNHGGFADRLRANWQWVIPLPDALAGATAGPLLCGGMTVFKPLLMHNISALSHVGVIGIGGLGHMAIKNLRALGAEVTAFSSTADKTPSLLTLGADHVVNSRDAQALNALAGQFDLIINTVAVDLDWQPYFTALALHGKFHTLGAVMTPFSVPAFSLIVGDRSLTGSSTGSPVQLRALLKLATRADIAPVVEFFPMSDINRALDHLRSGKAHYRIVLQADY